MTEDELAETSEVRLLLESGEFRRIREGLNTGLGEFAEAAGMTKGSLSRYERGLRRPRPGEAKRLARTLRRLLGATGE
jgi:transcriptional regulator with XRE-family HTH domain